MTTAIHLSGAAASATGERRKCRHCSSEFLPRFESEDFCCGGCRAVYELIHVGGFETFYQLLGRKTLQPADTAAFPPETESSLSEAIAVAEEKGDPAILKLRVGNLSCTACVWLIERLHRECDGALNLSMDTNRATLTLWWTPGEFDALGFLAKLHHFGYPAATIGEDEDLPGESSALVTRLGVTAGLAMNTMAFTLPTYLGMERSDALAQLFTLIAFSSSTLALAVGGSYFFQRAWNALKLHVLHMDVPISLGLAAAYLGSVAGMLFEIEGMLYFDFVATFAFLMLGGRWIHLRVLESNRRQLRARERDLTTVYRIGSDGEKTKTRLRDLTEWQVVEIPSGSIVPTAAQLIDGSARFHLDWINGEPDPVLFEVGAEVPAGARNSDRDSVRLITRENFSGSLLERLLDPAEPNAPGSSDTRLQTILRAYLLTVIVIAALSGAGWLFASGNVATALQVAISVLVVSCPCALGLALPLLQEIAASKLKRNGIFIQKNSIWSRLRRVEILAFDKTGTITEPSKRLTNPEVLETLSYKAVKALRALTANNPHPVGKALREILVARFGSGTLDPAIAVQEIDGKGVACEIDGTDWRLGRGEWSVGPNEKSPCILSRNHSPVARFEIQESVREGATEQLRQLRKLGFRLALLSGDPNSERVGKTAAALHLKPDEIHHDFSPEDKAAWIRANALGNALFVGDGGNDSLAFDAAIVSATPATGIKTLEQKADFVFTGRGFHAIGLLMEIARRRSKLAKIIFATAIVYNLFAIVLCLAGMMSPLLAAILMPLSSIATTAIAAKV